MKCCERHSVIRALARSLSVFPLVGNAWNFRLLDFLRYIYCYGGMKVSEMSSLIEKPLSFILQLPWGALLAFTQLQFA